MTPPIEITLYECLSPFFLRHGFLLLRDQKQFRRPTNTGFQNVVLSPVFTVNDTLLDVRFGCRNEQVEQIAQQFLQTNPTLRADANTLMISINNFDGTAAHSNKIPLENELPILCDQIEQFFDKEGFEFMTSTSTLPMLDRQLNKFPEQPCPFVYNQIHRFYKGIIAARLNYNPHFDGLVDRYRHLLVHQTQNPYEQLRFERLIAFLKYYYSAN